MSLAPLADLQARLDELGRALAFLDQCRADKAAAIATGAMRDAREWVEEAARRAVAASPKAPA